MTWRGESLHVFPSATPSITCTQTASCDFPSVSMHSSTLNLYSVFRYRKATVVPVSRRGCGFVSYVFATRPSRACMQSEAACCIGYTDLLTACTICSPVKLGSLKRNFVLYSSACPMKSNLRHDLHLLAAESMGTRMYDRTASKQTTRDWGTARQCHCVGLQLIYSSIQSIWRCCYY